MFHVIVRPLRVVMALAIAVLLGCAALLSVPPAPALAAFHDCPRGAFCLYLNEDGNGGLYHFTGSDPNLNNDRYKGGDRGETVGDTARYAENDGLREGDAGRLPRNWWNNIESFRWVTRAQCVKAGIIDLPRG
jgi:hypothetical protein